MLQILALGLIASSFAYQLAVPGRALKFPQDHFSHPDFKTEWWYYTGHFQTESGKSYGYQVTFFRFGLRDRQNEEKSQSRFESPHRGELALRGPQGRESIRTVEPLFSDLYMAHFALSDKKEKKFRVAERANRGYGEKAGAAADRYLVWNEDWKVEAQGGSHVVEVADKDVKLKLRLTPAKPPVLHGDKGLSQKAEGKGRASYYFSFTRLKTDGELEIAGKSEKLRGQSWMDHEFGSNQLAEDQLGWDWFSIQLDNNTELMLYLMRRKDGSIDPYSSGTLVYSTGAVRHLALRDFQVQAREKWKSPRSGGNYPMRWKVAIPSEGIELEIVPFFPDQELDTRKSTKVTYWEGSVQVRGTFQKKPVEGLGYVEMTGYAGKLRV
jgi:predicted secreted hydrolase